jgi:hypothetical protein
VASVLANVTLLTALLFYFGFVYTQRFFAYFGVHYTLLGQSLDEILARGVERVGEGSAVALPAQRGPLQREEPEPHRGGGAPRRLRPSHQPVPAESPSRVGIGHLA